LRFGHVCGTEHENHNRMQNSGKIYAVELIAQRYSPLTKMTEVAGCTIVEHFNVDALTLDDSKCPNVEYVIVDPSCSGSGMQRLSFEKEEKDVTRLRKLA